MHTALNGQHRLSVYPCMHHGVKICEVTFNTYTAYYYTDMNIFEGHYSRAIYAAK